MKDKVPTLADAELYVQRLEEHRRIARAHWDATQEAKARSLQAWIDSPVYKKIKLRQELAERAIKAYAAKRDRERADRERMEAYEAEVAAQRAADHAYRVEQDRLEQARRSAEFDAYHAQRDKEREEWRKREVIRKAELQAKRTSAKYYRQRRSRKDWRDVLEFNDDNTVIRQEAWERRRTAWTMHEAGLTYEKIAERFGVSKTGVNQMALRYERDCGRGWRSPIEMYLDPWTAKGLAMEWPRDKLQRLSRSLDAFAGKTVEAPERDWLIVTVSAKKDLATGDWRAP